jgi:hypothetical protein
MTPLTVPESLLLVVIADVVVLAAWAWWPYRPFRRD